MTEPTPLANLTADEYAAVAAYCDNQHQKPGDLDHAEVADILDQLSGIYPSWEAYAEERAEILLESAAGSDDQQIVRQYFDYSAWADELALHHDAFELPGERVAVFAY